MSDAVREAVWRACDVTEPGGVCTWPRCQEQPFGCSTMDAEEFFATLIDQARAEGAEAEREACAALIEDHQETQTSTRDGMKFHLTRRIQGSLTGLAFATAIRARKEEQP